MDLELNKNELIVNFDDGCTHYYEINPDDVKFVECDYGVSGSPKWRESNAEDVLRFKLICIEDDNYLDFDNDTIIEKVEELIFKERYCGS